ncbi:hypothetical protein [Rhodococcus erythropolis]|uniref:hypothetical protein n=1 Tax=Rhodococcus erythropolis TaxID=1833 RepID=UPI00038E59C5|nr:hypothetical protein [Rhodococcus erythropolis]EQM30684.1 hypothetical protein N601_26240 [Rhodococcus erythropolis DN1]
MSIPVFELDTDEPDPIRLVIALPATDFGPGSASEVASAAVTYLADRLMADPQLEDLFALTLTRGTYCIFDSARDGLVALRDPYSLLERRAASGGGSGVLAGYNGFVLDVRCSIDDAELSSNKDSVQRLLWLIGEHASDAQPEAHQRVCATRTVIDQSGSPDLLRTVCAHFLDTVVLDDSGPTTQKWLQSTVLSQLLTGLGSIVE